MNPDEMMQRLADINRIDAAQRATRNSIKSLRGRNAAEFAQTKGMPAPIGHIFPTRYKAG